LPSDWLQASRECRHRRLQSLIENVVLNLLNAYLVPSKNLAEYLPVGVQKSYLMLSPAERAVLNIALEKYRPGQSDPILVGGRDLLKPALRLMSVYRIKIEEVDDTGVAVIYTRWIESVQVRGEDQNVFVTLTPRFKRLWQRAKKRLPNDVDEDSAHIGLRSKYAIRLYRWAKKYAEAGSKRIAVEQIRKVLGAEAVTDETGKVLKEAPLPVWANLRQRALDVAIGEINRTTDLNIEIESQERSGLRIGALTFIIKTQAIAKKSNSPTADVGS
jgi:Initiator Replication protein